MKYIFKTFILFFFVSSAVFAQKPAAIVPDFDFYRLDNRAFTKKDLDPSKMLLFVFLMLPAIIVTGLFINLTTGIQN